MTVNKGPSGVDGREHDQTGPAEGAAFEKILASVARELATVGEAQFDQALTECLRTLGEFLGFDRSTVMLFAEHGQHFRVTHCWAREGIPRESPGQPVDTYAWFTQQIRLGRLFRMATVADLPGDAAQERRYIEEGGLKSTLAIPLVVEDTAVGAIAFGSFRTERQWPTEMVWRLRLVGEIVGLAVLRHQHTMALRAIVQTAHQATPAGRGPGLMPIDIRHRLSADLLQVEQHERSRISDVLHEDVMQMLFGISLVIERLQAAPASERSGLTGQARKLLQDALRKLGKLAIELRPGTRAKTGLLDGLRWLTEQMRPVYGVSVAFRAGKGIEPVREEAQMLLHSAAHKLLDNIAAHSRSNHASVEVERIEGGHVRLTVSDQGAGFNARDLEEIPSQSFGLFTIREQAVLLGGSLEVTSSPGHGTRAVVTVPG